jgi:hypothetical protein
MPINELEHFAALATEDASIGKKEENICRKMLCGNGKLPMNVFYLNCGSQSQGDENAVKYSILSRSQIYLELSPDRTARARDNIPSYIHFNMFVRQKWMVR